jgi:hypothetical protein
MKSPHLILAVSLFAVAVAVGADAYTRWKQPAVPSKSNGVVSIIIVRCDPDIAEPLRLCGEIDGTTVLIFRDPKDADHAVRAMMLAGVTDVKVAD